jgi:hypothetical protein
MSGYGKLTVASVTKAVPDRIYNIALHPSSERIVIAAGDSWGRYYPSSLSSLPPPYPCPELGFGTTGQ